MFPFSIRLVLFTSTLPQAVCNSLSIIHKQFNCNLALAYSNAALISPPIWIHQCLMTINFIDLKLCLRLQLDWWKFKLKNVDACSLLSWGWSNSGLYHHHYHILLLCDLRLLWNFYEISKKNWKLFFWFYDMQKTLRN